MEAGRVSSTKTTKASPSNQPQSLPIKSNAVRQPVDAWEPQVERAVGPSPSMPTSQLDRRNILERVADMLHPYTIPRTEHAINSYLFFGAAGTAAFGYCVSAPIAILYLSTYVAFPFVVHYFSTEKRHD